jgi:iron complex outermembrane recepter protein
VHSLSAQVFNSDQLRTEGAPSLSQTLQTQAQGVHVSTAPGNPYQPEVTYHDFVGSALRGTPQGLAVYVTGARFNDPFGDTVNWDLTPDVAISTINLEGSNPVFGLNALGGALAVQLKNGFTYHVGEVDVFGGSFGHVAGSVEYGKQVGNTAAYVAISGLHENGWRDYQATGLKQLYGDIGWRGSQAELHLNIDVAQTTLNGPGTTLMQLLAMDSAAQPTGPSAIDNAYGRVICPATTN